MFVLRWNLAKSIVEHCIQFRQEVWRFQSKPHCQDGQCLLEVEVADVDRTAVEVQHLCHSLPVYAVILVGLELSQKLLKFTSNVSFCLLLVYPYCQLTLALLCVNVSVLVDLFVVFFSLVKSPSPSQLCFLVIIVHEIFNLVILPEDSVSLI